MLANKNLWITQVKKPSWRVASHCQSGDDMKENKIAPWWGFSVNHGWVYLDRNLPVNQSPSTKLLFVRCDRDEVFEISREDWEEPAFLFEARVKELAANNHKFQSSIQHLNTFKRRENEYVSTVRFYIEARAAQKYHSEQSVYVPTPTLFIKRTPEQVRVFLKSYYDYNDDEWTEIIRYCAWMKEKEFVKQSQLNNYITRTQNWDDFKAIRALNDHGYGSLIKGISREAYKAVCQILEMKRGDGSPLMHSQRY